MDINIGDGIKPRIVLYSHDNPVIVASNFARKYRISLIFNNYLRFGWSNEKETNFAT